MTDGLNWLTSLIPVAERSVTAVSRSTLTRPASAPPPSGNTATPEAPITVRWVNRRLQSLRTSVGKRPNLHPKLQPGIPGYDFALELQPEIDGYNSVRQSCSYDFVATTLTKVVAVNLWL